MLLPSRRLSTLLASIVAISASVLAATRFSAADEVAVTGSITVHPTAIELRHQRQPHSMQVLGASADGFSARFPADARRAPRGGDAGPDVVAAEHA